MRHADDDTRLHAVAAVRETIGRIAASRGVGSEWEILQESGAVAMSPPLRDRLAASVAAMGIPVRELASGAGHDAVVLSQICPVGMLFVRSAGGISHDPRESVAEQDVAVALDVLEHAIRGA